jgi:hypothetical protein
MSLKGRSCWVVNIRMDEREKLSLEAIDRFVAAREEIRFESENRQQLYGWVERVLVQQQYAQQGKAAQGLARRYIAKMTGLSRAQLTRLIARYTAGGRLQATLDRRRRFSQLYTRAGIEFLHSHRHDNDEAYMKKSPKGALRSCPTHTDRSGSFLDWKRLPFDPNLSS